MTFGLKGVCGLVIFLALFLASPILAQEKKADKSKAEKIAGDIGLLDTEKNYMIVVTKDGKLVTIDFDQKTKVTALVPSSAKMSDIGLGSAASVQYTKKGDKNHLTGIEYVVKKGGD
jgi:lipopolysaccharide export system protein LptA